MILCFFVEINLQFNTTILTYVSTTMPINVFISIFFYSRMYSSHYFGRLSELTPNPARAGFCLHSQTASCILRSSKYFRYPETLAPAGAENASEVGVFLSGIKKIAFEDFAFVSIHSFDVHSVWIIFSNFRQFFTIIDDL